MSDDSPNFERCLTAIRREEADRVPIGEVHVDIEVKEAYLGHPIRTVEDEIDFWHAAGYDFTIIDTDLYAAAQIQNAFLNPHSDTANTYSVHRADRGWVATAARAIQTWEDVHNFPWPTPDQFDFTIYERARRHLPPGMRVINTTGHIFTAAWQLMGFETFCLALMEDPALVEKIIAIMGAGTLDLLDLILAQDCVGAVCISDDIAYTSGLMISPAILRRIFFPWVKKIADKVHAYGRPLLYHTDGDVGKVIPDIIAAGVDLLHPIEPKCMDIVEIKKQYGDRIALMGNLDLGYTLTRGTPDEVRAEVRCLMKNVAPGGGYIISSANSVTNYVPLENYRAMLEAAAEFGSYPIRLS